MTPSGTDSSRPSGRRAARALLAGYRDGARLRTEIVATFARRVVLAAGLRIVQLALEVAYTPYAGDGDAVTRLTERAEAVLGAAGAPDRGGRRMPLLNAPGQLDLVMASPLRAADALADVRRALALIAEDDRARGLLAGTDADPDPEGDLANWLYGRWWCGPTPSASRHRPTRRPPARGAARLEAARRTGAPTSTGGWCWPRPVTSSSPPGRPVGSVPSPTPWSDHRDPAASAAG